MNRREFLRTSGGVAASAAVDGWASARASAQRAVGASLKPWQPGFLDIHHINTGRGNSALVVMPEGSSLLIDAGASSTRGPAMNGAKPAGSRRAGQWIARYVQRQLKATGRDGLDYALLTHLHGDHVGDVTPNNPRPSRGDYRLTGISDVAEMMPIGKVIDRGFPGYDFPAPVTDAAAKNYIAFTKERTALGLDVERVRVGSGSQIVPLRTLAPGKHFGIRMIAGDGEVWTGRGESSTALFPPQEGRTGNELANENSCSIALRIDYGKFSYFTGGDLNCDTNYGQDPWRDVESRAARVAGPVSVSTCDHHGYFDATGPEFVKALRARVWVIQSWHASHPAMSVLANLYSPILYAGTRDVFCLGLNTATSLAAARFSDQFKSSQGHVVVRVSPDGQEYTVVVTDDENEDDRVKGVFGPYAC